MPDAGDFVLVGTTDTSPGTVATNFTVSSAIARTSLGGDLVHLSIAVTSDNAITSTGGNLLDTLIYTLDADYRPTENLEVVINIGNLGGGLATIRSDGQIFLRAAWTSIAASALISFNTCFLK